MVYILALFDFWGDRTVRGAYRSLEGAQRAAGEHAHGVTGTWRHSDDPVGWEALAGRFPSRCGTWEITEWEIGR